MKKGATVNALDGVSVKLPSTGMVFILGNVAFLFLFQETRNILCKKRFDFFLCKNGLALLGRYAFLGLTLFCRLTLLGRRAFVYTLFLGSGFRAGNIIAFVGGVVGYA